MAAALPGRADSCWQQGAPRLSFRTLGRSLDVDAVVIGAGIVGLTAALKLSQEGASVAVLEARRIGRQVTGRSTAKITTQHALIYRRLVDEYGLERARLYAEANMAGAAQIRDWIREFEIACDWEPKSAYAYATRAARRADIEAEAEAAGRVGLTAHVLDAAPLPFATGATLHFPDQAQFNPAHYLLGLARAARDEGALLFENTRVTGFEHGKRWRVDFGRHRVHADAVIMATALPINKPGRFDLWTQPRCHVAMAFRMTDETAIDGMFIGVDDPTHSLRMARDAGGPLLVALGPKFATGHDADVAQRFRDLAAWARREMGAGAARWHWANEDYDTPDGVPFVGAPKGAAKGYHVATGFNGWGITNGTAAGLTIADLIGGIANPWAALYDPTRAAAKTINRGGDTKSRVTSVAAIARGEGGVIMQGKNPVAVYRPAKGRAIARSASCTHLGCTVTWNNADKTWDCPCHGSIFSAEGEVIHGPAAEPLGKAKVPKG